MMEEHRTIFKEGSQKEKHIVVDPMSVKESSSDSSTLVGIDLHPPILQPPKMKFLSISHPNSPQLTSEMIKKKSRARSMESPCHGSSLTLKHHHHILEEINLSRSKSCGEGWTWAPSDEFDLRFTKHSAAADHDDKHHGNFAGVEVEAIDEIPTSGKDPPELPAGEKFKCSALCLYLPGFSKVKPVKARKEEQKMEDVVISRTVSLEKFECGSWTSSTLFHEIEGVDSKSTYFDLPMELVKCNINDVDAPITSAFVFEKNHKGVLKNGSFRTSARKSDMSPRHVRFSMSSSSSYPASPTTSISPRLRRAREDFNAFLEAQSA